MSQPRVEHEADRPTVTLTDGKACDRKNTIAGELGGLSRPAFAEEVSGAAHEAGLSVSDGELQQAADHFRQSHGLTSAERTRQWLAREGLTVDEFEAGLERDLLLAKFSGDRRFVIAQGQLCPHPAAGRPPPRSYPWVGQQGATDCGVAALAMVARYHGQGVSLAALCQRVRLGPQGASLLGLQQAAATLGFGGRAVHVVPGRLPEVTLPAIAHLAGGHYVVLYAQGADEVVIGDPASCVRTVSAPTFRQTWTGHLLLLTPPGRAPSVPRWNAPVSRGYETASWCRDEPRFAEGPGPPTPWPVIFPMTGPLFKEPTNAAYTD
jgi:predicted double-glycine peptidase